MKSSNHIARDFPDLVLPRAHDMIAGLLYVPLTAKAGQDFIIFLRKGQAREVKWAGKPYKTEASGQAAMLEPRRSFKTWSEIVTGRSRAWTDDQNESAGVLALIYGKFIQVWREKQSAMASNQLTAILLSNTSHAVRTPLSQIINTLELALSGDIDQDTRNMLENSHQASRALLFHVHDLLDLTRIETGNETAFSDPFDLRQSIHDAVRLYRTESARRNIDFRVNLDDKLPQFVIGDSRKVKTVISNLVANSVKYTEKGWIEVYCGLAPVQPKASTHSRSPSVSASASASASDGGEEEEALVKSGYVALEFVIADTGSGIPTDKLQAMFVTLEGADELQQTAEPTGLGLGLAVVARIVEQLAGQLRAESEVGVGSRFFFTVQLLEHDGREITRTNSANSSLAPRRRGANSSNSGGSVVSQNRSEIDEFVQDFGNSHMYGPVAADDSRLIDAERRMNRPGTFPVTDSSYPVRPTRVETDSDDASGHSSPKPIPPAPTAGLVSPGRPGVQRQLTSASNVTGSTDISGASASASTSEFAAQLPSPPPSDMMMSPTIPLSPHVDSPFEKRTTSFASRHAQAYPAGTAHSRAQSASATSSSSLSQSHSHSHGQQFSPGGIPLRNLHLPNGKQQLRVLVVEDDMINSQILQKRLKMDKHKVLVASNGQEAVDIVRHDRDIDAVLMDIQ